MVDIGLTRRRVGNGTDGRLMQHRSRVQEGPSRTVAGMFGRQSKSLMNGQPFSGNLDCLRSCPSRARKHDQYGAAMTFVSRVKIETDLRCSASTPGALQPAPSERYRTHCGRGWTTSVPLSRIFLAAARCLQTRDQRSLGIMLPAVTIASMSRRWRVGSSPCRNWAEPGLHQCGLVTAAARAVQGPGGSLERQHGGLAQQPGLPAAD